MAPWSAQNPLEQSLISESPVISIIKNHRSLQVRKSSHQLKNSLLCPDCICRTMIGMGLLKTAAMERNVLFAQYSDDWVLSDPVAHVSKFFLDIQFSPILVQKRGMCNHNGLMYMSKNMLAAAILKWASIWHLTNFWRRKNSSYTYTWRACANESKSI